MELLEYALFKSYNELNCSVMAAKSDLNKPELMKEVGFRLGTCLHWLIDVWERVESKCIDNSHKSYFSAFRYANNKLKHEVTLVELQQRTGGFSFPIHFPHVIPAVTIKWVKLDLGESKNKGQHNNYQNLLQGKEIIETVNSAKEIVLVYLSLHLEQSTIS